MSCSSFLRKQVESPHLFKMAGDDGGIPDDKKKSHRERRAGILLINLKHTINGSVALALFPPHGFLLLSEPCPNDFIFSLFRAQS